MKKLIIIMVIGALLFAWGTGTSNYTTWNENIKVENGSLIMENGAEDPEFKVNVPTPVLLRRVEMYRQYVKSKDEDQNEVTAIDWVEYGEPSPKNHSNPQWPDGLYSQVFYGDVKLSGSGLYLSDNVLEHFTSRYVNFENEYKLLRVKGLNAEAGAAKGFSLADDNTFTTQAGEAVIGDVRVTFWAVDPVMLEKEYTVEGFVKDGVIGVHEGDYIADDIYDRIIEPETLKKDRETSNTVFSIVFRILGAVLFLGPLALLIFGSRNRKKKV